MILKVKSEQIRTELYRYEAGAGENIFLPVKARHQEVLIVHSITIRNMSAANSGACAYIATTGGTLWHFRSVAAINAGLCSSWSNPIYLKDTEECGVIITPDAAGDVYQVVFQLIRLKDDEYDKPT